MIHPLADVEPGAVVHDGAEIWRWTHIRTGAVIEAHVSIGSMCYIGQGVRVPYGCRIQNGVHIHPGVYLSRYVFIGPQVAFTNDLYPRANDPEWVLRNTFVGEGASIGANATIIAGVTLGAYCMVGAGAVVTKDVEPYTVVAGNPARPLRACDEEEYPCDMER